MNRRRFLKSSAAAAAGVAVLGAVPPGDPLNVAFIGVGGRGASNLKGLSAKNNVVALCDVDERRAAEAFKQFPKARHFKDYRKMFDELGKGIDAVAISTPDHLHAVMAMEAIRRGLHVYCEKPLAHSVHELRALAKAARESKVVTQLGNQGHASESIRRCVEWIRAGAIGKVHTVHASSSAVHFKGKDLPKLAERPDVPAGLDWDLWLGPAADRPYHPMYLPGSWRGWRAFGSGTIGDWICHVVDPSFWALDLGSPLSVEVLRQPGFDPKEHAETFPAGCTVRFEFAAKGSRGPITLYWYSGTDSDRKPRPEEMTEEDEPLPLTGAVITGDQGSIVHGSHGAGGVRLVPAAKMKAYRQPDPTIPRVGDVYKDFCDSIREGRRAGADFAAYGAPLTELAAIGTIAMNFPGRKLAWDGEAGRFTGADEANAFLSPVYRKGWSL